MATGPSVEQRAREKPLAALPEAKPPKVSEDDDDKALSPAIWAGHRAEAERKHGPGLSGLYRWQDARLVAHGFPATSPYWLSSLDEFFCAVEEEKKRWGIWLAGRGIGKSTTLTRIAALGGVWVLRDIPPRQRWVWPFVSVRPTDADKRMEEMQGIMLDAYGMDVKKTTPRGVLTMELDDAAAQPISYISLASTIGNVKGPSCIGFTLDEEAAMRSKGANPSGEILASIIATFRARLGIFGIRCSSAWDRTGSHWNAVEKGNTAVNYVARLGPDFVGLARKGFLDVATWEEANGAPDVAAQFRRIASGIKADCKGIPTWVGNPTIDAVASRIDMEALDDATLNDLYPGLTRQGAWLREYGSIPPGGDVDDGDDTSYQICGDPSRYAGFDERRW